MKKPFATLLLVFITLFGSFAIYAQNQVTIMGGLAENSPLCSLPKEDVEEFKKQEGHCLGFFAVWLYSNAASHGELKAMASSPR